MNITCGTDIIEIERIKETIENLDEKFLHRVFTQEEIKYCESRNKMKYQHYAARFAAKEAIFKAISVGLNSNENIGWKNIQITNENSGRPKVTFLELELPNLEKCDISISHCKTYATANAVAVWKL